ncbi:S-layer protein, partial [Blautia producta]|nr:S-layer protein [Blautia producta]
NYTEAASGNAGYTNGAYGADGAYLGMENGKAKFMMSGVIGLVSANEVQVVRLSDTAVVSGYYVSGGRLIHGVVG